MRKYIVNAIDPRIQPHSALAQPLEVGQESFARHEIQLAI